MKDRMKMNGQIIPLKDLQDHVIVVNLVAMEIQLTQILDQDVVMMM